MEVTRQQHERYDDVISQQRALLAEQEIPISKKLDESYALIRKYDRQGGADEEVSKIKVRRCTHMRLINSHVRSSSA